MRCCVRGCVRRVLILRVVLLCLMFDAVMPWSMMLHAVLYAAVAVDMQQGALSGRCTAMIAHGAARDARH
eukprot:3695387-Rhodomonas_salina.1